MAEADKKLADAAKKQTEIDSYIAAEAENSGRDIRADFQKKKNAAEESLNRNKAENDR